MKRQLPLSCEDSNIVTRHCMSTANITKALRKNTKQREQHVSTFLTEAKDDSVGHPEFRFLGIFTLWSPASDLSNSRVACTSFSQQSAP